MSKYTPPPVTFHDLLQAMPALPMPLGMRIAIQPTKGSVDRLYACVELVYYGGKGEAYVYRRWGRDARAGDTKGVMRILLLACQEAFVYLEGKDPMELARFVEWQLGLPRFLA